MAAVQSNIWLFTKSNITKKFYVHDTFQNFSHSFVHVYGSQTDTVIECYEADSA